MEDELNVTPAPTPTPETPEVPTVVPSEKPEVPTEENKEQTEKPKDLEQPKEQEKPKDLDIEAIVQAKLEALIEAQKAEEAKKVEEERLKNLPEEEKLALEKEAWLKEKEEFEAQKAEFRAKELQNHATAKLMEHKLSTSFAEFVKAGTEEEIEAKITKLTEVFNTEVSNQIKAKTKDLKVDKSNTNTKNVDVKGMTYSERLALLS